MLDEIFVSIFAIVKCKEFPFTNRRQGNKINIFKQPILRFLLANDKKPVVNPTHIIKY